MVPPELARRGTRVPNDRNASNLVVGGNRNGCARQDASQPFGRGPAGLDAAGKTAGHSTARVGSKRGHKKTEGMAVSSQEAAAARKKRLLQNLRRSGST